MTWVILIDGRELGFGPVLIKDDDDEVAEWENLDEIRSDEILAESSLRYRVPWYAINLDYSLLDESLVEL